MKIFKDYQNHDAYPRKDAFKFTLSFEFKGQIKAVEYVFDKEGYKQAVADYNKKTNELVEQFKQDLFEDLNIETNPKCDLFFNKIYYMGRSEGFYRVYELAVDLVDLIK